MSGFVISSKSEAEAYRAWAAAQVCRGCGAKASDRKRDVNGVVIDDWWATETLCGECYRKGVKPQQFEERPW